jgi:hypothetical protein
MQIGNLCGATSAPSASFVRRLAPGACLAQYADAIVWHIWAECGLLPECEIVTFFLGL